MGKRHTAVRPNGERFDRNNNVREPIRQLLVRKLDAASSIIVRGVWCNSASLLVTPISSCLAEGKRRAAQFCRITGR
jgi:hypothetical protein